MSAEEAESAEERLLSLVDMAAELGLPVHRVRAAAARLHDRIPWQLARPTGQPGGRKYLYGPVAVAAIRRHLEKGAERKERAAHEGAAHWNRLARLAVTARVLAQQAQGVRELYHELRRNPPTVSATIATLPDHELVLIHPLSVLISPLRRLLWRASWPEAQLAASGSTHARALFALREGIVQAWLTLAESPEADPERFQVLAATIRRRRERPAAGDPSTAGGPP